MQLLQNDRFTTLAWENRIRLTNITARVSVFDRNGIKLEGNQPVYTVTLVNLGQKDTSDVVQRLASILGLEPAEIQAKIDDQSVYTSRPRLLTGFLPRLLQGSKSSNWNYPVWT